MFFLHDHESVVNQPVETAVVEAATLPELHRPIAVTPELAQAARSGAPRPGLRLRWVVDDESPGHLLGGWGAH